MRILIAGDDGPGLDALCDELRRCGHQVRQANRQDAVIDLALDYEFVVLGLRLGADDCVARPFSGTEVVTRIDAVARRCAPARAAVNGDDHWLRIGALAVNARARRVILDGAELYFTRKEFDLLKFLAENAGAVCAREEIIKRVWDEHWFGSTRTLDVHIGSLRRKLGEKNRIENVRGVGFRLGYPP